MFVDFRAAFGKDPGKQVIFPNRVVEEFDKGLPKGARYHVLEDGSICIGPVEGEEFIIGGFRPEITAEIEAVIGSSPSADELAAYSYNAQKPVRMTLTNPGFIGVKGAEVSIDEYVRDPLQRIELDKGSFILYPSPFPKTFDMLISSGDGESAMSLKMRRVLCDDARTMRFESDKRPPIVGYELVNSEVGDDETSLGARFSISIKPGRCTSLADVVNVLSIYQSALDGTCKIAGVRMGAPELGRRGDPVDDEMISWFKKALEVESYLSLHFQPRKIALDCDVVQTIEELYTGLVGCEAIRVGLHDASVDLGDDLSAEVEDDLLESTSGQIALSYSRPCEFSLFGVKVELLSLCGIFGFAVSRIDESGGGRRLFLQNADGVAEGYRGRLLFKGVDALDGFFGGASVNEVMQKLRQAKPLQDYVDAERLATRGTHKGEDLLHGLPDN